jgi:hypothetical protein
MPAMSSAGLWVAAATFAIAGPGCGRPPATAAPPAAAAPPGASASSTGSGEPGTPDAYRGLVAKAEAGESVDFHRLRMAYLASPAFHGEDIDPELTALRDQMFAAMKQGIHARAFELAQQLIARSYVDLDAHEARRHACAQLGRPDCARYEEIERGLVRSVIAGRDGQSCETGWEVVAIDEEYFLLRMLGLTPQLQALMRDVHLCDRIETSDANGARRTVYFDIGALMAASERALGLPSTAP